MEENLKSSPADQKIQELFEQLLSDVMHNAAYSPHSALPPISKEASVFEQISHSLALPITTVEQILSNKYRAAHIATPSIISSNEAIELYARYFTSLNLSETPWLPLQTIGPGMVICHFMPNFPLQEGLPEDLISKVIIPPKDYFSLLDELREVDIATLRSHLEITTTFQDFAPLSNIFSLSPQKFAQYISRLFLPTSNVYLELQKLSESLDDIKTSPAEFIDSIQSLFPEEVSAWALWRYKLKTLADNPFFTKLGAEYLGFFRPLELIDPKAPMLDKLPQTFLYKLWSYNFGVLALSDRTLFLVKDIAISDVNDSSALSDLRKISGQYLLKFAYCRAKDLIAYISNQRDTYSALRAKSKLVETTIFGSNLESQSNILQLSPDDELSDNKIADFVNSILAMAIEQGASDIHIEPIAENCVIRYRLDGVLHRQIDSIPGAYLPNIVNRVKTLSTNMDIIRYYPIGGVLHFRQIFTLCAGIGICKTR